MIFPLSVLPHLTRRLPRARPTYVLMHRLLRHYTGRPCAAVAAEVHGYKMTLEPSEFADCAFLLFPHLYDPDELAFLSQRLRPGDSFVDAGAYIGLYSLVLSRAVGDHGTILAIEPEPTSYQRLCAHLQINDVRNVQALNVGLSDKRETLRLSNRPPAAGFKAASTFLFDWGESVEVQCLPLLDVLVEHGIGKLRAAKFDIEGLEYRVLAGFLRDADPSLYPDFIVVEFQPDWVEAAGGHVVDLLRTHGYRVWGTQALNYIMARES